MGADRVVCAIIVSGQGSPIKLSAPSTPSKVTTSGVELRDDIVKYYKDNGLDSFAKEVFMNMNHMMSLLIVSIISL